MLIYNTPTALETHAADTISARENCFSPLGSFALMRVLALVFSFILLGTQGTTVLGAQVGGKAKASETKASDKSSTPPRKPMTSSKGGGRAQTPSPSRSTNSTKTSEAAIERTYWESIRDSSDPEDFRAYLRKYPDGEFVDLANNRIRGLESAARERSAREAAARAEAQRLEREGAQKQEGYRYGQQGTQYLKDRQYTSAAAAFENAIRLQPDVYNHYLGLAYAYAQMCKKAEANRVASDVQRLFPSKASEINTIINTPEESPAPAVNPRLRSPKNKLASYGGKVSRYPNTIYSSDGNLRPAAGYEWVNPNDPKDLTVKQRVGVVETSDGQVRPSAAYQWVNPDDPTNFQVQVRSGVIRTDDGKFRPANGYVWINPSDPNDLSVKLKPGLVRTDDGQLRPAKCYRWVNPNDPKDLTVVPIQ